MKPNLSTIPLDGSRVRRLHVKLEVSRGVYTMLSVETVSVSLLRGGGGIDPLTYRITIYV